MTSPAPRTIVAFDTETTLMSAEEVNPRFICMSAAVRNPATRQIETWLAGNSEEEGAAEVFAGWLEDDSITLVGHNVAFDLAVMAGAFPALIPAIFRKLESGQVTDTKIREKLINLSTHGRLDSLVAPDGSSRPIKYSLATLVLDRLGFDRKAEKEGDDIWRLNFCMLDGVHSDDYPSDAAKYARQDASDTLLVYESQAKQAGEEPGFESTHTEQFHTAVDFTLRLITCWGFAIDQAAKAEIEAMLRQELAPEKLNLLVESGVLKLGSPPMPYANGAKSADGTPKMKAAKKDSVSMKTLQAIVSESWKKLGLEPTRTAKDGVSTASDVIDRLADVSPILAQYKHRQKLQKLVSTYLPALTHDTVHPEFDVLKETGRTSSYGGNLYPSCNIQQVDPRVRKCYVPRPGMVLCSVDYQAIELASFAQRCFSLFGYSVHRDLIAQGVDLHAYLGAQLAVRLGANDLLAPTPQVEPMRAYEDFKALENVQREFYDHWRKFAKPTGLGLPGGMGDATFATMAFKSYGLTVDEETAAACRQIWFDTYPEAKEYFEHIKLKCRDPINRDSYGGQAFCYTTNMGMFRAGATYCAAANGFALQSDTAEGAKAAVFNVTRACYDWTQGSRLFGCRPVAFIHDELIVEIPEDPATMHENAFEIAKIMVDSMQNVMPDVAIRAEPALMRRWDKKAKAVYDEHGRLSVWEPSGAKPETNPCQDDEELDGSQEEARNAA